MLRARFSTHQSVKLDDFSLLKLLLRSLKKKLNPSQENEQWILSGQWSNDYADETFADQTNNAIYQNVFDYQ